MPPGPPLLVLMSAPSGAGKDAVRELLRAWGLRAHFAVTATTRPRRPDEVDGFDYHFLDEDAFAAVLSEDGFIEHATVYGRSYGVPREEIEKPLANGEDVIARVDVQGAASLRRLFPDALLIFIAPPTIEEAQRRLQARQTDSDEATRLRVATAPSEMEAARSFDYVVVNETGKLEAAARRVVQIIAAEKRRRAAT
jgi:guanylate kinase